MAYVFVTVGTTAFDALVDTVVSPSFAKAVIDAGFCEVRVQIGRGLVTGAPAVADTWQSKMHDVVYKFYRLKPSIAADIAGAGLVVSHAGAGSIFETLRAGRPLMVVINTALADNHQLELAGAMADRGHCIQCLPSDVPAAVALALQPGARVPLPPRDLSSFVRAIDSLLPDLRLAPNSL